MRGGSWDDAIAVGSNFFWRYNQGIRNLDLRGIKGIDVELMKDGRNENKARGSNSLLYIISLRAVLFPALRGLSRVTCTA